MQRGCEWWSSDAMEGWRAQTQGTLEAGSVSRLLRRNGRNRQGRRKRGELGGRGQLGNAVRANPARLTLVEQAVCCEDASSAAAGGRRGWPLDAVADWERRAEQPQRLVWW